MRAKERAAARIQAGFRGYRVRKQLRMARQQGKRPNGPRRLSASQGADGGDAAPTLQPYQQEQRQEQQQAAPTPAPAPAPADSPARDLAKEQKEVEEALELCATKIQAGVRGFLVRRRRVAQHRAACTIQAGYRAFRARRDARLRAAAKI